MKVKELRDIIPGDLRTNLAEAREQAARAHDRQLAIAALHVLDDLPGDTDLVRGTTIETNFIVNTDGDKEFKTAIENELKNHLEASIAAAVQGLIRRAFPAD